MKNATSTILACVACLATCVASTTAPADGDAVHFVDSPNGKLRFEFFLGGGVPTYRIFHDGHPAVHESRLGLGSNPGGHGGTDWIDGLIVAGTEHSRSESSWENPFGERRHVVDRCRTLTIFLRHADTDRGALRIEVRAYDEGIAFRYLFPEDKRTSLIELDRELTEFNVSKGSHAFWTPSSQQNYQLLEVGAGWPSPCEIPVTIRLPDGRWISIAEAANTRFPRTRLMAAGNGRLVTQLYGEVTESSPFATPWRVVMVANRPGELLERNYLLLNLNPPVEIEDPSWIRPGKVIREMTLSTDGAKRLVDFAVEQNIEYVHFDAGWYGYEYDITADATTVTVDPRRNPIGDLDLPEAIRYAKSRDRRVMLYVNHRALVPQMDTLFPLYRSWGVDGVKFGFVHTGSYRWNVWLHDAVRKAADHRLVVNVHDNYRPSGFSRTFPNLLTQEGILGNEGFPSATQSTIYPFTRSIAGAADHTFCFNESRLKNTKGHQLALPVVIFSPLQYLFWYGKPDHYPNRAEIEYWKDLPTVWDDTRVVDGVPGEYVVVARRKGDEWWIGAVTNVNSRRISVPLSFLQQGREYVATLHEDRGDNEVHKRTARVDQLSFLQLQLLPSGGAALRVSPTPRHAHATKQ